MMDNLDPSGSQFFVLELGFLKIFQPQNALNFKGGLAKFFFSHQFNFLKSFLAEILVFFSSTFCTFISGFVFLEFKS